ncbi:Thoeris anti-defense Tad2 family protein [Bacillus cereus]|uniref:Thoeris anti-defense Tad2 family protein n=1 Tax=Bacillus cereus TaxID=1396 RepID=UPI000BF61DFB|nr:MW1434 family type I TA system toxin [Bacillus cereus]PFA06610.1 hypothetical protein CN382_25720 [Bacillus cereus]
MEFNAALALLKEGKKITRGGKMLFIALDSGDIMEKCASGNKGAGNYTMWKPTQADILASDWVEVK